MAPGSVRSTDPAFGMRQRPWVISIKPPLAILMMSNFPSWTLFKEDHFGFNCLKKVGGQACMCSFSFGNTAEGVLVQLLLAGWPMQNGLLLGPICGQHVFSCFMPLQIYE